MYNSVIDSFILVLPEIALVLGIILLITLKIFKVQNTRVLSHCTIPFLLVSIYLLLRNYLYFGGGYGFNDTLSHDTFTYFAQALLLVSAVLVYLMLACSEEIQAEVPLLLLASVLGGMLVIVSNDFIILYLGLELASFGLYTCVSARRHSDFSLESGIKYFILGSSTSAIYLFGVALIYLSSGSINFDQIAGATTFAPLITNGNTGLLAIPMAFWIGIIMLLISLCFKLSIAPFHLWAPDVYQGAPTVITAFIGSVSKITAICITIKLICNVFDLMLVNIQQILIILAVTSMLVGSLGGIAQKNLKRMLAYSTITHMGFILSALTSLSNDGLNNNGTISAINYLVIYIISIIIPLFASIIYLAQNQDISLEQLSGLKSRNPVVAFILSLLMLSSLGIPPLPGFFAKFYVISSLVEAEMYKVTIFLLLMSVLSSFYYLRVIRYIYFTEAPTQADVINQYAKEESFLSHRSWELKILMSLGIILSIIYPILAIDSLLNLSAFVVDVLF